MSGLTLDPLYEALPYDTSLHMSVGGEQSWQV